MTPVSFGGHARTGTETETDTKRPGHLAGAPVVAERVGFEPTDHIAAINALAGRPIRPLWHLSWERWSVARYPGEWNGGRVDECSRLESGRPQGPQVRILSVPLMGSAHAPGIVDDSDPQRLALVMVR
jgi:hypothetical protein